VARFKVSKLSVVIYAFLNLIFIICVHLISDIPVSVGNWETKSALIASFKNPEDNFYPPGGAILLIPFLILKPHYEIAIFFYFTLASVLYFFICEKIIKKTNLFLISLSAFTLNPYLLWLVHSSQDTVFELFLLLSGFALVLKKNFFGAMLPLYLLCLTRPAYWPSFLMLPVVYNLLCIQKDKKFAIKRTLVLIPFILLIFTLGINKMAFDHPELAGEAGMTAHFGHNKSWYIAMPKFDYDVFLSKGGNMDTNKLLLSSDRFSYVSNKEFRAALIYIVENPKSLFLNTLQKIDTYFFSVQKNPHLSGEYYLSSDQKSIVIGEKRDSWVLILGSYLYFIHRALLLIFLIASLTILVILPKVRNSIIYQPQFLFFIPYLFGSIAALLFLAESRFKVVSEMLLVPFIASILDAYKSQNLITNSKSKTFRV
jgi:hypothetical protein